MTQRLYLYPGWLRLWHWSNAFLFAVLIVTGLSMHYADLDSPLVPFNVAITVHNIAGFILSALYLFFIAGNLIKGNWRHYVPVFNGFMGRAIAQARFYLFEIYRGGPHPIQPTMRQKFNPLQQITYLGVMYFLMPILVVTGLFLQFPTLAPDKILGAGGIWPMAVAHSVGAFFLSIFMMAHIYLATTGDTVTALFKHMATGWHEIHDAAEVESQGATDSPRGDS